MNDQKRNEMTTELSKIEAAASEMREKLKAGEVRFVTTGHYKEGSWLWEVEYTVTQDQHIIAEHADLKQAMIDCMVKTLLEEQEAE